MTEPQAAHDFARARTRPVAVWLFVMAALVALMVTVGGATRLTDSGLSIVEWRPVTGAAPPLSAEDWQAEFEKYKTIPEYAEVNFGMSMDEFKRIYWWEWGHRFLGRLLGVAFLIPLIAFAVSRRIDRSLGVKLGALFLLGGMQGALGWWMVASGLTERVDVSQYRLAAHLGLAIILFGAILWIALDLTRRGHAKPTRFAPLALAFVAAVYLQMILGAFVAGLRAGRTFNTWPLMDGRFFPDGYFHGDASIADLFETTAAVQFNHRIGAYFIAAFAIILVWRARAHGFGREAGMVAGLVVAQIALGVWTVIAATPLWLGLAHQALALGLFAAALSLAHGAVTSIARGSSSSDA